MEDGKVSQVFKQRLGGNEGGREGGGRGRSSCSNALDSGFFEKEQLERPPFFASTQKVYPEENAVLEGQNNVAIIRAGRICCRICSTFSVGNKMI